MMENVTDASDMNKQPSAPAASKSQGGKANKKIFKKHKKQAPPTAPTSRPAPSADILESLPAPKALAKKQTPLTNDPLWSDALVIEGETGFTNKEPIQEFHADAAGYVNLLEAEYNAICDVDKNYAKSVSASAHAYYHNILLWYKLALTAQKRGTSSHDQDSLVRFVDGYPSALMAAGAATHLSGLGDFEDVCGVKHYLTSHEPDADGTFGQVTADTHNLYEALPSPSVCVNRVLEDLGITRDRHRNSMWNIHRIQPAQQALAAAQRAAAAALGRPVSRRVAQDVEPEDDNPELGDDDQEEEPLPVPANTPTPNLLGWRPAKPLHKNQLPEIENIFGDDQEGQIHWTNARFRISRGLFELVYRKLLYVKGYKMVNIPKSTFGTLAQCTYWRPDEAEVNARKQNCDYTGTLVSRVNLPVRLVTGGKVMAYRTLKYGFILELDDEEIEVHPWSCFSFNNFRNVPQTWINNRNALISRGFKSIMTAGPFSTAHGSRNDAVQEMLTKSSWFHWSLWSLLAIAKYYTIHVFNLNT